MASVSVGAYPLGGALSGPSSALSGGGHAPSQPAPSAPALENTANNSARAGQSPDRPWGSDRRASRWHARGTLWHESSLDRVRHCGRYPISSSGEVQVRRRGDAVGYAGLQSCGSVWADPVCNSKIQAFRRVEVGAAVASALATGSVAFGAYTTQHHLGQRLDPLWRQQSGIWNSVATDKKVRECRADLRHRGIIRAAEVTYGAHGWHPHGHPIHVFDGDLTPGDVAQLHREQVRAWTAAAQRRGLNVSPLAQHLHLVQGDASQTLGDYFAKSTWSPTALAWEVTSTQTKSKGMRASGATPWDLLNRVHDDGDADALDLWHEWEQASRGKRALTWSRGLRQALLSTADERSDDDIASAQIGSVDDVGLVVTDWSPVQAAPVLGGLLLSALSRGGWDAAERFCLDHHIDHRRIA